MKNDEFRTRIDRRLLSTCAYGVLGSVAMLLLAPAPSSAQETVVIGGSRPVPDTVVIGGGQPQRWVQRSPAPAAPALPRGNAAARNVVVDLSVLDEPAPANGRRQLRLPTAPPPQVVLRPPERRPAELRSSRKEIAAAPVRLRTPAQTKPTDIVVLRPPAQRAPAARATEFAGLPRGPRPDTPEETARLNAAQLPTALAVAPSRPVPDAGPVEQQARVVYPSAGSAVAMTPPPVQIASTERVSLLPSTPEPEPAREPVPGNAPPGEPQPHQPGPTIIWMTPPAVPAPTPPPPQTISMLLPPAGRFEDRKPEVRADYGPVESTTPLPPRPRIYWTNPPSTSLPALRPPETAFAPATTPRLASLASAAPTNTVTDVPTESLLIAHAPDMAPRARAYTLPPPRPTGAGAPQIVWTRPASAANTISILAPSDYRARVLPAEAPQQSPAEVSAAEASLAEIPAAEVPIPEIAVARVEPAPVSSPALPPALAPLAAMVPVAEAPPAETPSPAVSQAIAQWADAQSIPVDAARLPPAAEPAPVGTEAVAALQPPATADVGIPAVNWPSLSGSAAPQPDEVPPVASTTIASTAVASTPVARAPATVASGMAEGDPVPSARYRTPPPPRPTSFEADLPDLAAAEPPSAAEFADLADEVAGMQSGNDLASLAEAMGEPVRSTRTSAARAPFTELSPPAAVPEPALGVRPPGAPLRVPVTPTLPYPRFVAAGTPDASAGEGAEADGPRPTGSARASSLTSSPLGSSSGADPRTRLAGLPPAGRVELSVPFETGRIDLTARQASQLQSVVRRLSGNPEARLQIVAYADVAGDGGSAARRLSLSRALAVRAQLIENGVQSTRIDVRAMGNRTDRMPSDRVDLAVVEP